MSQPDLTGMKGLKRGVAQKLVEKFSQENPEAFQRWMELERSEGGVSDVYELIEKFLRQNCKYKSLSDITYGVGSLRGIVHGLAIK